MSRLQSPFPAIAPCLVQTGGKNGIALYRRTDGESIDHRKKCESKSLGTPYPTHLWINAERETAGQAWSAIRGKHDFYRLSWPGLIETNLLRSIQTFG